MSEYLTYDFVNGSIITSFVIFRDKTHKLVYATLGKDKTKLFRDARRDIEKLSKLTKTKYTLKHDDDSSKQYKPELLEFKKLLDGELRSPQCIRYEFLFGTPFQRKVWKELVNVPFGETVSYKSIARRLGNAKMSRAVGGACAQNRIGIIVPCHRIVGSSHKLTGFGWGLELKRKLLENESIARDKDR